MAPVGALKLRRVPEAVRRRLEVAAASAWEALVEAHATHAARFVALMAGRMAFDEALSRYLAETDVRDPMASSVRSRVLVGMEAAEPPPARIQPGAASPEEDGEGEGLRRFRPGVLMRGIARKYRESEESEQWIALAIARAEEAMIRVHIENAIAFSEILDGHAPLNEAVEDYIELLRVTGGRAQAVFQRSMARLADVHLPESGRNGRAEEVERGPAGGTTTGGRPPG